LEQRLFDCAEGGSETAAVHGQASDAGVPDEGPLFHMELRQRVKPWRQGPLDKTGAVTGGFVGGTTAGLLVVGIERRGIKNP